MIRDVELSDNDFRPAVTEVLQQAIIIMLETNEKIENLKKDNKGIQLYIHKLKNLSEMDHFLKIKKTHYQNSPKIKW